VWLAGRFTGTRAAFVAIPGAWLALELLRSCFPFGGFPWALLGYSQFPLASFIQIAEFGGVYLIGGLVMMANVAIYTAVKDRKYLPALVCAVLVAMGSAWGHYRMGTLPEGGEKLRAAVCQASIPQEMKWDLEQINPTIDIYERLTREAVKQGARIAVWPETACPFFLFQQWPYSNRIIDLSRSTGIRIVTGSPSYDDGRYLNRVWLLEDGKIGGYYDKVHLVPFGEYLPLAGLIRPFFSGLTEEIGNFSTTQQEAYPIGDMGVLICFESVFPGRARDLGNRGAAYLINAANDAWVKTWSTPRQHLEMACFRSIETRRWLLSAVNHGISAVVSPEGRIVESIGLLREGFIVHDITLSDRSTFYTRFGPIIACLWAGFSLIAALTRRKARC
jgi:apolipoprotein N-acyltransferase